MKKTILLTGAALLFSAGLFAQTTDETQVTDLLQTRKRDQIQLHDQTGTGDKIQKKDQLRVHDQTQLNCTGTAQQGSMLRQMKSARARTTSPTCTSAVSTATQSAMRMSKRAGVGRR